MRFAAAGRFTKPKKLPEINIETLWHNVAKSLLMPPELVKKLEELEDASRCFQLTVKDKTATPCLQILNTLSQDAFDKF